MKFTATPRPSPIAGTWYSKDPDALAKQMDGFIEAAVVKDDDIPGKVIGIISPHAGHRYSGRTAGYAYKAARGAARGLAVILSPFHAYASGDFLTTSHGSYRTPLGDVPVAADCMTDLVINLKREGITMHQVSHDEEHSLEIQLPFLQRAWGGDFKLIPVMVCSRDPDTVQRFAKALHASIKGLDYLLIASTDLSHFHPMPAAEQLDAEMLRRIKSFDPLAVLSAEAEGKASACGASAVAAALWVAELDGADYAGILNYSTSADVTGDTSSVVGYGAAVLTKTK